MLRSHRVRRRRGGWFQKKLFWSLNQPPRPRLSLEREFFVDGASSPPLPRRGVCSDHSARLNAYNSQRLRVATFYCRSAAIRMHIARQFSSRPTVKKEKEHSSGVVC